tara:strand:+ start:803 stop:1180 length:378 start_codon:yes stop_codon:yes gene_type:complete
MAITANMTTHDGISLTDAYCYIPKAYVKKFDGEWIKSEDQKDEEGNVIQEGVWSQEDPSWQLIYDVYIYVDKEKRLSRNNEKFKLRNDHVDHFKVDYDLSSNKNAFELAYEDLKVKTDLSNIKDV